MLEIIGFEDVNPSCEVDCVKIRNFSGKYMSYDYVFLSRKGKFFLFTVDNYGKKYITTSVTNIIDSGLFEAIFEKFVNSPEFENKIKYKKSFLYLFYTKKKLRELIIKKFENYFINNHYFLNLVIENLISSNPIVNLMYLDSIGSHVHFINNISTDKYAKEYLLNINSIFDKIQEKINIRKT